MLLAALASGISSSAIGRHVHTISSLAQAPTERNRSTRGVAVSIKDVSLAYSGRTVLEHLDLEIEAGEFVAIVGRSGCGKSTLLRSVVSLETPQTGTIILGKVADNVTRKDGKPDVRVMFQDSRLLPWRRILPNVMLGLEPALTPQARKVLSQVGLAERANEIGRASC